MFCRSPRDLCRRSFCAAQLKNDNGYPPAGNANPSEVSDTIVDCGNWFWQPGLESHLRSADEVVKVVRMCNERRANYLLDVGPDKSGRISDAFVNRMKEIGSLLDTRHPE